MGKSQSKSVQNTSTDITNKNLTDTLNKTIINTGVETLVKNAASCSSAVNQNNTCSMENAQISGDFNFSGDQSNKAKVDFSCVQASVASAEMGTSMMQSMMAEMNTLNGTKAGAQLNNAAASSNKSGFGATGGSSKSDASTVTDTKISNITENKIKNIYQQNLNNNFTSETVQECIGKTLQSNTQNLSGIKVGGNANIKCNQSNTLEQVSECKQMASAIAETTQNTLQELGIVTETASESKAEIQSSVSTKSENESIGPIGAITSGISGILDSAAGLLGMAFIGPFLPFICCAIIIILIFMFVL
jgi:hypothetical protein